MLVFKQCVFGDMTIATDDMCQTKLKSREVGGLFSDMTKKD